MTSQRRVLRVTGWILATLIVLVAAVGAFGWWEVTRSFPQTRGTIDVHGLDAEVTVQRDGSGVPSITADTAHDLFAAQGYVHAQDRFWEMDFRRHMTAGRLSELFGESQVDTDKFLRTLDWHGVAEQEYNAMPQREREYYDAYAEGVNAYLAEHRGGDASLEYAVLGLQNADYEIEPWSPEDSLAWLKAMAWDLRTNLEDETTRALIAPALSSEQLSDLYPAYPFDEHPVIVEDHWATDGHGDPQSAGGATDAATASADTSTASTVLAKVDAMISEQGEGIGSNSWVVSGEHTTTGKPLLANDPHLGAAMPSVWTQMQLRCSTVTERCPFDVAGFSFSGLPGIVIGHNSQVAWGFTNLTTDVADLYVEKVDGDDYWRDGEREPLTNRTETIEVAGGDDVQINIRETAHGPIVSGLTPEFTQIAENPRVTGEDDAAADPAAHSSAAVEPDEAAQKLPGDYAVSLAWTALSPGTTGEAIFQLNTASTFSQFRKAAKKFDVPAQNLVYADVEGNIGYQAPGRLPERGAGDGWLPQPGWDSSYDWRGYIPFADQPHSFNPEKGYIVTANNAIVTDDYPYFLSRDWDYGYRAARIDELLRDKIDAGPVDAGDLRDIQMDNQMPAASALQSAYKDFSVDDADVQQALDAFEAWDGQNDADSAPAAYANVLWRNLVHVMLGGKGVEIPADSQARLTLMFAQQLEHPDGDWWKNADAGVNGLDDALAKAANDAHQELSDLQGTDQAKWNWGDLHAITLTNATFGTSGIRPIEMLFNRGPYPVGGGGSSVNATGWDLDGGYETTTVPSMRMVIDVSDWDASSWIHLTGASGHAFNPHYVDQTPNWQRGEQRAWLYSREKVDAASKEKLTLKPE